MIGHERYKVSPNISGLEWGIASFLWKTPSDKVILPVINGFKNKKVLDVGCGSGEYSKIFLSNGNSVKGADRHPELAKGIIPVKDSCATNIAESFKDEKFDVIFSAWMTEYLSGDDLKIFFENAKRILKHDGEFIFTVISDKGWGKVYVDLAGAVRKVRKYAYTKEQVETMLKKTGFKSIDIKALNSHMGVPWAFLVTAGE